MTDATPKFLEAFIGLSYQEALYHGCQHGYTMRVAEQDGKPCVVTRDYRKDRLNVKLDRIDEGPVPVHIVREITVG